MVHWRVIFWLGARGVVHRRLGRFFLVSYALFTVASSREDANTITSAWVAGALAGCGLVHCASGLDPAKQLVWLHDGSVLRHLTVVACGAAALVAHSLLPIALATPSPTQFIKEIEERRNQETLLTSQVQRSLLLRQVTREIRKSLCVEDICANTTNQLGQAFGADRCAMYLCQNEAEVTDQTMSPSSTPESAVG